MRLKLSERDEFLILACDGLWARASPASASAFVRNRLVAGHSFLAGARVEWPGVDSAVRALVDDAVNAKGCTDNVSAMVLRFGRTAADG